MKMGPRAEITFVRLPKIPRHEIIAHMTDPRVAEHMPLLTCRWDDERADAFVAAKETRWARDELGHWGILASGTYVGWGGFQKEGGERDFGLVLKPSCFGLGLRIARQALAFAVADVRISYVAYLLPLSRKNPVAPHVSAPLSSARSTTMARGSGSIALIPPKDQATGISAPNCRHRGRHTQASC